MKPALPALQTYIDANDTVVLIDLFTFSLIGGGTLRVLDYPLPSISVPAANFPGSPLNYAASGTRTFTRTVRFGKSKVTSKVGIEPASADVVVFAAPSGAAQPEDLIGALSWQQFAQAGGFDGANVEVNRLFLPAAGATFGAGDGFNGPLNFALGAIVWFYGRVADITIERSRLTIKVKAMLNLLQQQQMPRRLFQSGCTHIFGDPMCGYDRVGGKNALGVPTGIGAITITATSGSSQTDIVTTTSTATYYSQGSCVCLTGQNAGISRGIISNGIPTIVGLYTPFPFAVAVGDTFQLLPGCDHTSTGSNGCQFKSNILRYGGFDYVPPPEFAL